MSKIAFPILLLVLSRVSAAQFSRPAAPESNVAGASNQVSGQQLSPEEKDVWNREQDYFRYFSSGNLAGFMALWDDSFVGWPDYSAHPVRKPEIRASIEQEFRSRGVNPPLLAPEPEAVERFGDIAVTHYLWPASGEASQSQTRITHTWRKASNGWQIIGGMGCDVNRSSDAARATATPNKSVQHSSESSALSPPSPHPGPEIQRLVNAFAGTWSIALKVEPNDSLPNGAAGQGEETWRLGPGGLSLIEDYHSTGDEGEIHGLGVAWWDENEQRYQVTWCDGGNPAGCSVVKHGAKWEGSQLVAVDEWEMAGKKFTLREVFSDTTPTSFKQTVYQGESGGELKKIVTIVATKVASLPARAESSVQRPNLTAWPADR